MQGQGLSQRSLQDTSQLLPENNRTSSIDADLADQIHLVGWEERLDHITTSSHHQPVRSIPSIHHHHLLAAKRTLRINPTSWTRVHPNLHRARPWGRARLLPRQFTEEIDLGDRHHPRLRKGRPLCLITPPLDSHPSHPPWANFAKIRVRLASSRPRNHNNQPRARLILSCRTILDLSVESRGGGGRVHLRGVMK